VEAPATNTSAPNTHQP
jgi:hypothetical protein